VEDPAREDAREIIDAANRDAELTRLLLAYARRQVMDLGLNEAPIQQGVMLTSRQLAAVMLVVVLLVGLATAFGYVTGRLIASELRTQSVAETDAGLPNSILPKPTSERTPPLPAMPSVEPAPAPREPGIQTVRGVPPAPAIYSSQLISPKPNPGQKFLQVAAADRVVAGLFVERLARRGFPARVVPGPDASTYRVLVGPLTSSEIANTNSALERARFTAFVRVY
jgi:hypothetical protein